MNRPPTGGDLAFSWKEGHICTVVLLEVLPVQQPLLLPVQPLLYDSCNTNHERIAPSNSAGSR